MDVMFLCWDIFVFSWVNVNFQRVTVRIAMCNSGDHGLVCLQLIFFSASSVIWLSSLFSDSSSSCVSVRCWAIVNNIFTFSF